MEKADIPLPKTWKRRDLQDSFGFACPYVHAIYEDSEDMKAFEKI
jgi:hypothetical protein